MSEDRFEPVEIADVRAIKESDDGLKVRLSDGRYVWIPKSQIDDDSEVHKLGTTGTLIVPRWLAEREGLE